MAAVSSTGVLGGASGRKSVTYTDVEVGDPEVVPSDSQDTWWVSFPVRVTERVADFRHRYNECLMMDYGDEKPSQTDEKLFGVEDDLDVWGTVPVVSNLSAIMRACIGVRSMVIALGRIFWYALVLLYYKSISLHAPGKITKETDKIRVQTKRKTFNAFLLFVHGLANLTRAVVEFIPIVGNFFSYQYDDAGFKIRYIPEESQNPRLSKYDLNRLIRSKSATLFPDSPS